MEKIFDILLGVGVNEGFLGDIFKYFFFSGIFQELHPENVKTRFETTENYKKNFFFSKHGHVVYHFFENFILESYLETFINEYESRNSY